MQHRILINQNKSDFIMYWGESNKTRNTISSNSGIFLPLNRRGRVETFIKNIPVDDRDISISNNIKVQILNGFDIDEGFEGRIHIKYSPLKHSPSNDTKVVKVWKKLPNPLQVKQLDGGKQNTFKTRNLKVFTIPLIEAAVVAAADSRSICCFFPIINNKGIIGETISEISNGSYMTDCRPELLVQEIIPELQFFIHIKDKEMIGAKSCSKLPNGYYVAVKDFSSKITTIYQTHDNLSNEI